MDRRAAFCRHIGGVDNVFDADWHAVQRPFCRGAWHRRVSAWARAACGIEKLPRLYRRLRVVSMAFRQASVRARAKSVDPRRWHACCVMKSNVARRSSVCSPLSEHGCPHRLRLRSIADFSTLIAKPRSGKASHSPRLGCGSQLTVDGAPADIAAAETVGPIDTVNRLVRAEPAPLRP